MAIHHCLVSLTSELNQPSRLINAQDRALLLVKSSLAGAAQKYYIDAPYLKDLKTAAELLNALEDFFTPPVKSFSASDLSSITMFPDETIQSLEHRIIKMAKAVYPDINEPALQQIMLTTVHCQVK